MKRKLLFVALCVVSALGFRANAKTDVTGTYLVNANLSSLDGWTVNSITAHNTNGATNVVEFWNKSDEFSLSQTITIPAGYYRLAVNAFYRESWTGNGTNNDMAWIFAGETTMNVAALGSMDDLSGYEGSNDLYRAATAFSQGKYSNEFDFHVTEQTTLEIGFKGTCPNGGWCILGPVALYEYTVDDYKVSYNSVKDLASAALENPAYANVTGEERTSLSNAISATIDNTIDAYIAAEKDLKAKMNTFINAKSAYDAFVAEKEWADKVGATVTAPSSAAEAAAATQNAKVKGFNAIAGKYTTDGSALFIPSWDKDNFDALSNEHWSGKTSEYFDKWNGGSTTCKIYKTVTLPEGHYAFYAAARGQAGASTATLKVQIGEETIARACTMKGNRGYGINTDGEADFTDEGTYACDDLGFGWEWQYIVFDLDAETEVTLSIEGSVKNSWVSAGDTKLLTYENIAVSKARYDTALDIAQKNLSDETYSNVQGDIRAALEGAATAEVTKTFAGYDAAAELLENANEKFVAAKPSCDSFYEVKTKAEILVGVPYSTEKADAETWNLNLSNALATQTSAVETAKTVEAIDNATVALKDAMKTYVFAADPQEGSQFDLTFLMTNPDLTNLPSWQKCDGWSTEQEDGNYQVMNNDKATSTDGTKTKFYEYWSFNAKGNGKFNLYNQVTLPKGTYTMSCYAFAKQQDGEEGKEPVKGVFFYANDTQGSCVSSDRLTKQAISFVTDEEQSVKIGLKPLEGNTYNWMGIGYVELYKQFTDYTPYTITMAGEFAPVSTLTTIGGSATSSMALKTVTVTVDMDEIEEGTKIEVTAEELDENGDPAGFIDVANPEAGVYTYQQPRANVKVTVQREKKEIVVKLYKPTEGSSETHGMSTFIAPYDVDISDKKYNKDIQAAYTVDGVENGELVMTAVEDGLIPAYTPVILECKKTKSVIEVTFNDNVEKPTKTAPYTEGLLTGVLTETYAPAGKYVLQNQDDGLAFYRVDKEKTIKVPAYKAYLTMEGSAAKAIFFPGEDEEANAIAALDVLTSGYDGIYTANGVQVNALQKGLNVVKKGGKSYKIFVK